MAEPSMPRTPSRSWSGGEVLAGEGQGGAPAPGDVVRLGEGVSLLEQRGRVAVVTKTSDAHVSAVFLDEARRRALGECWPGLGDVRVESAVGRLGSRIAIQGLASAKTSWCNGLTGVIVAHRSQGHPVFLSKDTPSSPTTGAPSPGDGHPILVFCIQLDCPPPRKKSQQCIEHRFLVPYQDFVDESLTDLCRFVVAPDFDQRDSASPPEVLCGKAGSIVDPTSVKDVQVEKSNDQIEDVFAKNPFTPSTVASISHECTPRGVEHACVATDMISSMKLEIQQIREDYGKEILDMKETIASMTADVALTKVELDRTNESLEAIRTELGAMRVLVGGDDDSRHTTGGLDKQCGRYSASDGKMSRPDARELRGFGEHWPVDSPARVSFEGAVLGDSGALSPDACEPLRQSSQLRSRRTDAPDHVGELRSRVEEMTRGQCMPPATVHRGSSEWRDCTVLPTAHPLPARLDGVGCPRGVAPPRGVADAGATAELERRRALSRRLLRRALEDFALRRRQPSRIGTSTSVITRSEMSTSTEA